MKAFVKELYQIWISERPNQLAAALAYYSMFSFAPIIFIAISLMSLFFKNIDPAGQFFQRLESFFGAGISDLVQKSVTALSKPSTSDTILVSVVSFLVLLFAASGLFFQLQYSLNTIWRVPPPQKGQTTSYLRQRLFSFIIVIGVGLLGVVAVFANLFLAWFGSIIEKLLGVSGNQVLGARLAVFILIALIFAIFYKILPETKVAWRDIWLGAIAAAVLTLAAMTLAGLFFQYTSFSSALEAAGAFTVLLTLFYFVAQIFLFGAICSRVYAGTFGSQRSNLE